MASTAAGKKGPSNEEKYCGIVRQTICVEYLFFMVTVSEISYFSNTVANSKGKHG